MTDGVRADLKSIVYLWPNDEPVEPGSDHFAVNVMVFIGQVGDDSADCFDLTVCSPSMLPELYAAERWRADGALPGGNVRPLLGLWLMKSWSAEDLEDAVKRLLRACSPGPTWDDVAARIDAIAPWEYDYRHAAKQNRAAGLAESPGLAFFWQDDA